MNKKILCIGNITQDIINYVDHYPAEDEEMRAYLQKTCRGGNAANTAVVLAQYQHPVYFLGMIARDAGGDWLLENLQAKNIDHRFCPRTTGRTPTSYIALNTSNGSRTIVHYRELEELSPQDFFQLPLNDFDWIHFEGRNLEQIKVMLQELVGRKKGQTISLEVEKPRPGIEALIQYADVVLFSKSYAMAAGFRDGKKFLLHISEKTPGQPKFICAWGDQGAFAMDSDGQVYQQDAAHYGAAIDTIGAGDTFNAGIINALSRGYVLPDVLIHATELAGRKVVQRGFDKLVNTFD